MIRTPQSRHALWDITVLKYFKKEYHRHMISLEKKEQAIESPERIRLRELEQEDKWVFHGSGDKIDTLEPRQAYNYPANSGGEQIPDDKPAVFASPNADIAIFMSIFNRNNASRGFRCGYDAQGDGSFKFRTTKYTMDQIHDAKGYVYVFDKTKFISRSSSEVLSYESVVPAEVIVVSEKDLPKNILIEDF